MSKTVSIISAVIFSLGILGGGFFVAKAVYKAKVSDHYVTVKGLSQREVKADLGIWEIDYREVGNSLPDLSNQLQRDQSNVVDFLKKSGFVDGELEIRPTKVTDHFANVYSSPNENQTKDFRYILTGGVRVRTTQVDLIAQVNPKTSDLIRAGVPLSFDTSDYSSDLSPNPSYFFTKLDSIRPAMLAESTQSALTVASQFSHDSNTQLQGIRRASQGVFQIMARDAGSAGDAGQYNGNEASSLFKKVRLVTTIDYFLKNSGK